MLALSILPSRSDVSTPQNTSGIPGKMVSPVPQQEVQRRAHDRDDEIDRLAGVSPLIVIAERAIGAGIPELRRPQRFRVEIDVAQKFHRETRAQAVVEDGEARELLVLIVDDQDVLRCRVGCRGIQDEEEHDETQREVSDRQDRLRVEDRTARH
jgi:DNA helicase HerA-like ATPase